MELTEVYTKLAKAIITRAIWDYRTSREYLRKHPGQDDLKKAIAAQRIRQHKQYEERWKRGLPCVYESRCKEKTTLARVRETERLLTDAEKFFLSDWFYILAEASGEAFRKRLIWDLEWFMRDTALIGEIRRNMEARSWI